MMHDCLRLSVLEMVQLFPRTRLKNIMLKILRALPPKKKNNKPPVLQALEEGLKSGSLAVAFVPKKRLLSPDVPQVSP